MKPVIVMFALALPISALAAEAAPLWSFFVPEVPRSPDTSTELHSLPGSDRTYTWAQIDDLKSPPDWYPKAHAPLPAAVIKGGEGTAFACGSCHLISGMGHPESASLAGQPAAYMRRQMADFKSGARNSHVVVDGKPQRDSIQTMVGTAKAWSEADSQAAIDYFAAQKPRSWVKVVESDTAPRSFVNGGFMRVPAPGGGTEPLGQRIVELPQDLQRQLSRDPNSGTVAYVPVGAVAKGKVLANGSSVPCTVCHGADNRGVGEIPSIAGRSPLYIFRQLYAFKDGSRDGAMAAPMKAEVAQLSQEDMLDLSAYLASLTP